MPANLHVCAAGEHVPINERSIRTVKERARSATVKLPFKTIPQLMIISLLEGVERWTNAFPTNNIDQSLISPTTIIEGKQNPRDDVPRIPFGSYTLVYTGTSNTLDSRSTPGIPLRESNNNGGHYFMSLESGCRILSNKWVEMPTTQLQINRVHKLASNGGRDYWLDKLANYEDNHSTNDQVDNLSYTVYDDNPSNLDEQTSMIDEATREENQDSDTEQTFSDVSNMTSLSESPDDHNDSSYQDEGDDNTSISHSIINSGEYTFNINNAYELDSLVDQNMVDQNIESTINTIATPSLDSTSSISEMDIPVSQLVNDESSTTNTESSETKSRSTMDGTQLFQL